MPEPRRAALLLLPVASLVAVLCAFGQAPAPTSLTLTEARGRALAQSPRLAAAAAELLAAEAEVRQAGLWPNPELEGELEELDGLFSRSADSETKVALQQALPLAARRARVDVARLRRDEARLQLELAGRDVAAQVERRFWTGVAAQERLRLAESSLETANEVTATVRALVEAGERSPIDLSRVEAEGTLVAASRGAARRDLVTARGALAEVIGEPLLQSSTLTGDLPVGADVPDLDALAARLATTAEARLVAAGEQRLEAETALVKREALPEPALRLGTFHRGADREMGYVAGLAIQLPLWDRRQGALAAARARQAIGRQQRRAEELRLDAALRAAHAALVQSAEETHLALTELLPRIEEVFAGVSEGYRRGKLGLLEVLEARRTLASAREQALDARLRLALARVELDRLVGRDAAGAAEGVSR